MVDEFQAPSTDQEVRPDGVPMMWTSGLFNCFWFLLVQN